jgi:glutamyl-tRNA synthetase
MTKEVRTRFAPSPTGFQHIGGFRTAFYAYLLAKHHGGKFLLRIEDTDQERKVPGAVKFILEELAWLGIVPDEAPSKAELAQIGEDWEGAPDIGGPCGPYTQSLRLPRYKEIADLLVEKGVAYRCDCTAEMLERERNEQMARKEVPGYSGYCRSRNVSADTKHVVRFKMPHRAALTLDDPIKGKIVWDSIPLRDTVLLKSDGFPTYHLAVVVDDHDMRITHVMRGDEWISTAPLHLMLYQALGWEPPVFAHLPVIMGSDGKKLSKRTGAVSSNILREEGYLPQAILNYVVLIGWNPGEGTEQEVFTREELVAKFSLERINNASGVFDQNKFQWMNGVYIRNLPVEEFMRETAPFLKSAGFSDDPTVWRSVAPLVQERVKNLKEVPPMVEFLFVATITRNLDELFVKDMDKAKAKAVAELVLEALRPLNEFDHTSIEAALRPIAEKVGMKVGPMLSVVRIGVTGRKITPPLFESLAALGKEKTIARMEELLQLVA